MLVRSNLALEEHGKITLMSDEGSVLTRDTHSYLPLFLPPKTCSDLKTPLGPVPSSPTSPVPRLKRSSGIPMSFMVEVKDPNTKGAMLTPSGKYAIPIINL